MTLSLKYDDLVPSTLTLSENSLQRDSETCFLSDQTWTIIEDIWSLYWVYHDYIVYDTLFNTLQCSAVDHSLTIRSKVYQWKEYRQTYL